MVTVIFGNPIGSVNTEFNFGSSSSLEMVLLSVG